MSIEVTALGRDTVEWDAFVRASDEGTPFHLTSWKRAVEQTFGFRSHYLIARRGGGTEGVLPLFEIRDLSGGRALVSVPYAVYGGVCAESHSAREALIAAARAIAQRRRARYVELRQKRDQGLGLPTKSLYVTFARTISKDEEENARMIPRKQRRMTRQGAKHGLRSAVGDEFLDAVYDLYARSLHNLGTPVFPRRLFAAIAREFGKDCEILTIWHEDRLMAGVLTLLYEDQALPYYGADVRDPGIPGTADSMYWELMCRAARAGYRIFDFGRSREGTGSYDFKRHWGFEPVALPYQYVLMRGQGLPDLSPSNPKFRMVTALWRRLPLHVANALGPRIARFLP
jgi:FemAB-related protein (PEP-CTERM system-associated)